MVEIYDKLFENPLMHTKEIVWTRNMDRCTYTQTNARTDIKRPLLGTCWA